MPSPESRPLPRHPRVWWSRIIYRWPFVIWCGAVALCAYLFTHTSRTGGVMGVVDVQREELAPIEAARLTRVLVIPGQQVQAGEAIAEFDTAILEAEMNEIRAQFALDQLDTDRQFRSGLADAETRLHELELQQALDFNQLEALRAQWPDLLKVSDAAVEGARGMALMKAEIEALERNAKTYPAALDQARAQVDAARMQLESARTARTPAALADLLASLAKRKDEYVVRARKDGVISTVLHVPGDVVPEADPVATLVVRNSQRITAFLPEWTAHEVQVGSVAWVTRHSGGGQSYNARVESLGPEIMPLPGRVSPLQGQTMRGRHAVLALESPAAFLPGESVHVHFQKPWWMDKYLEFRERAEVSKRAPAT